MNDQILSSQNTTAPTNPMAMPSTQSAINNTMETMNDPQSMNQTPYDGVGSATVITADRAANKIAKIQQELNNSNKQ